MSKIYIIVERNEYVDHRRNDCTYPLEILDRIIPKAFHCIEDAMDFMDGYIKRIRDACLAGIGIDPDMSDEEKEFEMQSVREGFHIPNEILEVGMPFVYDDVDPLNVSLFIIRELEMD